MLTINRILKTNGVTGEWSDEFGPVPSDALFRPD